MAARQLIAAAGDKDSGEKSTAKELEAAVGSGEERVIARCLWLSCWRCWARYCLLRLPLGEGVTLSLHIHAGLDNFSGFPLNVSNKGNRSIALACQDAG